MRNIPTKSDEQQVVLFDYPPEIRRVIYTTHAIESMIYLIRNILKTRGACPSDEPIFKLVFLG